MSNPTILDQASDSSDENTGYKQMIFSQNKLSALINLSISFLTIVRQ